MERTDYPAPLFVNGSYSSAANTASSNYLDIATSELFNAQPVLSLSKDLETKINELIHAALDDNSGNCKKDEEKEVDKKTMNKFPDIEKYLINDNAVIVFFKDGTKEVAKCDEEDSFSLEQGIAVCVCKKIFGHNVYTNIQKVIKNQKKAELAKLAAEEKKEADRKLAEEARAHRHERKLRQKAKKEAYYQKILQEELKKN